MLESFRETPREERPVNHLVGLGVDEISLAKTAGRITPEEAQRRSLQTDIVKQLREATKKRQATFQPTNDGITSQLGGDLLF